MSLLSWNIHGLKSIQSTDALDYLRQFDIVSLVETWTSSDSDVMDILDGYISFSQHSKRRSRFGRNPG